METVSQGPGSRAGWAGTETSEAGAGAGAGDITRYCTRPGRQYKEHEMLRGGYYVREAALGYLYLVCWIRAPDTRL